MSDLFGSSFLAIFNIWNPTKHQKHCGQTGQTYFVSHHIHGWSASKDARPFSPVFRVVCRGWTGTTSQSWGDTRLGYWPGSVGWDMSGFQKPRNWMKLGDIPYHSIRCVDTCHESGLTSRRPWLKAVTSSCCFASVHLSANHRLYFSSNHL